MSELRGVEVLQSEIEKSRGRLKNFNENIKKLTGFENPGPRTRRILSGENPDFEGRLGRGRGRLFGVARRGLMEDGGPVAKRRVLGGAFSRLGPPPASARRREREDSPYEDELPNKLSLQSSVVATSREAKNREEIMQEQNKDKEGMQRNRRMFGLLLGTLNKFKTESKTLESKEEQRKRIDKKLEENDEKERKKYKQETKQLMEEMHMEETRISRLEQKMEVVQEHSDWEREVKKLKNFICTKTKPQIFWFPRAMNSTHESRLKDSNKVVDNMLKEGQARLEKDIQDVMDRENKREERIRMRLKEDGLFQEDEGKGDDSRKEEEVKEESTTHTVKERDSYRLEESVDEPGSKTKQKRRVVIEEEDSDGGSQNENEEEQAKKQAKSKKEDRHIESIKSEEASKRKKKGREDSDKEDDDDDDSSKSSGDDDKDQRKAKDKDLEPGEESSRRIVSSSKRRSKERSKDSAVVQTKDQEESGRVVMRRSSSRDRDRSRKEKHRSHRDDGESNRDQDSRKHSKDSKHSSRHSKRSRKDSDRVVVKQEQDERQERKKKKKGHEKDDEDEDKDDGDVREAENVRTTRNPTTLLGEEDDVEMESENNVTM